MKLGKLGDADRQVAFILRAGAYGSMVLLLAGLLWSAISVPLATQVMRVGVLLLLATPVLRVVTLVLFYLHTRDWKYAFISFLVLLIVLASSLLGIRM